MAIRGSLGERWSIGIFTKIKGKDPTMKAAEARREDAKRFANRSRAEAAKRITYEVTITDRTEYAARSGRLTLPNPDGEKVEKRILKLVSAYYRGTAGRWYAVQKRRHSCDGKTVGRS